MKILMHSCCAPCTTFPLHLLRSLGHEVDSAFYNPNIHPLTERDRRFSTLQEFADKENLVLVTVAEPADHRQDEEHNRWLAHVSTDLAKPGRCRLCYAHRLLPIARMAKEKGYDCFTTSLLLSIYQDHEGIVSAGEEAASQAGVGFLNMDFRVGYRRSREMARGRHLYMQKYCGCEFSYAPMTMEGPGKR